VVEGPGFLGAQAKNWSVVKIWVALEGSRGLARDEDSNFYWIGTLEIYLYTGPKSGEGTFAQGGDSSSKLGPTKFHPDAPSATLSFKPITLE
jgi:hypothetical protein